MFPSISKYNYMNLDMKLSTTAYKSAHVSFEEEEDMRKMQEMIEASDILVSNIKVRKEAESPYQNNVYFRDPLNGAYVNVGLSYKNLDRLQEVFGENALKTDGKNILLKGRAEEFVSSWYADITYKRGYLREDVNQDGFLDRAERMSTHSFNTMQRQFYGGTKNKDVNLGNVSTYIKHSQMMPGNSNLSTSLMEKYTSHSIEEELNKMITIDQKANGSIRLNQLGSKQEYAQYLDEIIHAQKQEIDSIATEEDLKEYLLKELLKKTKESLKKQLKKSGMEHKSIEADASLEEVMDKIVESPQSTKEPLEKIQTQATENEDPIFTQIQKLTKLDKQTLKNNLENNPDFEEDIIAIVQGIAQNVDRKYASNTLERALDIKA